MFRIFVVDDGTEARAALKYALEQRSEWVVVGEAYNGRHALFRSWARPLRVASHG